MRKSLIIFDFVKKDLKDLKDFKDLKDPKKPYSPKALTKL